ncbi:glycosyltransferase WbsX family protein [Treponema sp.]|uniref:glycosyltransferase WbsX family protein n=1 Tax=Treponema sp. TaxID=166 RepID=UPI003FA2548D
MPDYFVGLFVINCFGDEMTTKIISFYLPQYHQIPENDEWWGEGFTEWTNVKKTKPVFKGQTQPNIPLHNNFYNLLDKHTVEWQTDLATKYGIYGFCYFHYYFKGKKLLEKPAENLLKWRDIKQNFCFMWANVSWKRTWKAAKVPATTWIAADGRTDTTNGFLMEQTYGDQIDWTDHFNYLLDFFKDDRYIKKDNKPVFLIYHVDLIPEAQNMFALWNNLAKKNGFNGVHIVSTNKYAPTIPQVEAIAHYGPGLGLSKSLLPKLIIVYRRMVNKIAKLILKRKLLYDIWDYEFVWKMNNRLRPFGDIPNYAGGFVKYDDTPRRGTDALYIKNASPDLFEKYLQKQVEISKVLFKTEFLFLDAWNEWGEGNYLEPDVHHEYAYLDVVKRIAK